LLTPPSPLSLHDALPIFNGPSLDLADALAGDVELPADLVEGRRLLAVQPEAHLENSPFPVVEALQDDLEALEVDLFHHLFERREDRKSTRLNSSHVKNSY